MIQKINYADKQTGGKFSASDANEIKSTVNLNADVLSENSQSILSLQGGQLGPIKPTDSAPTPARNGNYTFSIGGNKPAWLTAEAGVTTVKAGDGVSVVYTAPSSYTYTHVDVYAVAETKNNKTSSIAENAQSEILYPNTKAVADYISKLDTFSKISIFKNNASQKSVIGVSNFIINTNLRRVAGYTFGLSQIFHNVLNAGKYKTFVSFYSLDSSGTRIDQDSRYYYENNVSTVKTGIETITLVVVAGTQHITGTITVNWDVLPVGVSTINANTLSDDIFQSNELYDFTLSSLATTDSNLKLLGDLAVPKTPFENFTSNIGTGKFANLYTYTSAYGLVLSCYSTGIVYYGIVNKSNNAVTPIGSVPVNVGLNTVRFATKITLTANEYIYVSGSSMGVLRYIYTGDVGAWDITANSTSVGLAISYGIIKNNPNVLFNILNSTTNSGLVDYGHFILPSSIEVAVGRECNLWWDAIANYEDGDDSIQFSVISLIGQTDSRCFKFTPTITGNSTVKLISKNLEGFVIDSKTITIKAVAKTSGTGSKNILMLGDSRTWQNISDVQGSATYTGGSGNKTITTELKALLDANLGASFNFVGTCISAIDATVKNEAYSGYSYDGFLTLSSVSPFWNPSTNQFDLPWYMSTKAGLSGQLLDYVTIMFGVNDITYGKWTANTETMYADMIANIPGIVNNAKLLVQKFINANANCKIILVLEPTTCESQDSFGYWGKTYQSYGNTKGYELERAMKQLRAAIITAFDNGAYNSNVIISSAGLWCDRTYGFPYTTESMSSRASVATKLSFKNSIHPHDDGYKQIADGLFSTIKFLEQ